MRNFLFATLILSTVACQKDKTKSQAEDKVVAGPVKPAKKVIAPEKIGMTTAHQSVVWKLNEGGMMRIPEVKAKSEEMLKKVIEKKATLEEQAIVFDKWLNQYAANHPEEVKAAKREQESAQQAVSSLGLQQSKPPAPIVLPVPQAGVKR